MKILKRIIAVVILILGILFISYVLYTAKEMNALEVAYAKIQGI